MRHRIGLIADVQYADIDDVWNFMKTHKRKYRSTLQCLRNAIDSWRKDDNLDIVVDLGDAIDGFRNTDRLMGMHALDKVMREWSRLACLKSSVPVLHLIGNHELYKFTRTELVNGVEDTGFSCIAPDQIRSIVDKPGSVYYSFRLAVSSPWRIVVLDPYAESVMTLGGGRVGIELTLENGGLHPDFTALCRTNNPNDFLNGANYFDGLTGDACRWSPFNGGLGEEQLNWLKHTLATAVSNAEKLIVLSHVILHPSATPGKNCHTLLWDYDKVLDIFKQHDCVKLVLTGHAHHEGYHHCSETGIHHVSLESPLEAPDDLAENTFASLTLEDDVATIEGSGWVKCRTMLLR